MAQRAVLAQRRRSPALGDGALRWIEDAPDGVLALDRDPRFRCVVNFGPETCPLPTGAEILVSSGDVSSGTLGVDEAVWLRLA